MKKIMLMVLAFGTGAYAADAREAQDAQAPAVAQAIAKNVVSGLTGGGCKYQEQVALNVSLNSRERSVKEAKSAFERRIREIEDFAKKNGVKNIEMTSVNYNINAQPQYNNGVVSGVQDYMLSGNINYKMDSSDIAAMLVEELAKQNIQASMNVNSYRNQPCLAPMDGITR